MRKVSENARSISAYSHLENQRLYEEYFFSKTTSKKEE